MVWFSNDTHLGIMMDAKVKAVAARKANKAPLKTIDLVKMPV